MILRKAALLSAAMALASTPAWALPANAPSNDGTSHAPASTPAGPPSETPNYSDNSGAKNRSETGNVNAGGAARSNSDGGNSGAGGKGAGSHGSEGTNGSSHGKSDNKGNGQSSDKGKGDGKSGNKGNGKGHGDQGASHKCKPHRVAYIAAGRLLSDSLKANENHTYSGELTVEVQRTNHHADAVKGTTVTYAVEDVKVRGPVSVEALKVGDRVRLIGGITFLPKKCVTSEFKPMTTIRMLVFHAPPKHFKEATTEETATK